MSLLPTVAELDLRSGAADLLSYLQATELKLSNITSATFEVMDSNEDGTVDEAEKAYFDDVLADSPAVKQAIRGMAAAIKVVVDDPYVSIRTVILMAAPLAELPDDFDVMDLVGNDAVLALFKEVFCQEIQDVVEAMRQDPMLMDQFGTWANNLPIADDGVATTLEDHPVTGFYVAVDPDDDPLAVTLVSGPSNGALAIDDNGAFTYTPNQDFNGTDGFTYTVNDGTGESNEATVVITIAPVNDAPVLDPIGAQMVTEGMALTFAAMANDPDLPVDTLTFSLEGAVPIGAVIHPFTGAFSWIPTEPQGPATYSLTVRVSDAGVAGPVLSDTALFTVTVFEDGNMDTGPLADDGEPDTYRLRLSGDNIEALLNDTVVFASPFEDASQLTITGSADSDTLIVDLSGGNPIPAEGVFFNGGGPGDSDTLIVTGGSAATVTHTFTGAGSGTLDLDGSMISYTGLEPILDEIDATDRVFTFGDAADTIFVSDDGMPNNDYSRISSDGSSETVDFRNPTGTLTINTDGGNDTVSIVQLDSGSGGGAVNFGVVVNDRGGDLQIGSLNAGPEREVILTSNGGIFGTGQIVASALTVRAARDIALTTNVATLTLIIEQSGDATISEADDITLSSVQLSGGTFAVSADNIIVTGTVSANEVNLEADGVITAAAPALLTGGRLTAATGGGMNLNTALSEIIAAVTDSGDIVITEVDTVVLSHITTADGNISVAAGEIPAGVTVAGMSGDVTLASAGSVTATVTADELSVLAAGGITLTTTVARLEVVTTAAGALTVTEVDDIVLTSVQAHDGPIMITAGGDITAILVESLTDSDENDITLTTTASDIHAAQIRAGSLGDVTIDSTGTVTVSVTADELVARSRGAVTLETTVSSLDAEILAAGSLVVTEYDAIHLVHIQTFDGSILITAGGEILAGMVQSLADSDANDVSLIATAGDIEAAQVAAGSEGDVSLNAAGELLATVFADELAARAGGPMTLNTTVSGLVAETGAVGPIAITETDAINLRDIQSWNGPITVTVGGTITVTSVVSHTDSADASIVLTATNGDILIDLIKASGTSGEIHLISAGDIRETDSFDPDIDMSAFDAHIQVLRSVCRLCFGYRLYPHVQPG